MIKNNQIKIKNSDEILNINFEKPLIMSHAMKKPLELYIMKSITLLAITITLLLCFACGSKEKKDKRTDFKEEETKSVKTSKERDINLKQNGDYTELYVETGNCKITTEQLAEALGISENKVTPNNSYQGSCWFKVLGPDNLETNYGISLEKFSNSVVNQEINNAQKQELMDIRLSETGDTYITRHPVQGFLLLLNPNYTNTIKVSYSYFNRNGPKPTPEQQEERKQNTYKLANYIINQYKN